MDAMEGERKNYWSFFSRYPAGTLHRAVEVLQMFVGVLKRLRNIAEQHADRFESEGFSRLFAMLKSELSDEYFIAIEMHLSRLKFRHGVLISAQLGNGNKGKSYTLRKAARTREVGWHGCWRKGRRPTRFSFILVMRPERGRCRN